MYGRWQNCCVPDLSKLVGQEIVLELLNPVVRPKRKKDKTQKARLVGVEPACGWRIDTEASETARLTKRAAMKN
jgi:hypothetical protein